MGASGKLYSFDYRWWHSCVACFVFSALLSFSCLVIDGVCLLYGFSTSAPLGALVLLVASDVISLLVCVVVPLLMSNSGATSKCNYDGFR